LPAAPANLAKAPRSQQQRLLTVGNAFAAVIERPWMAATVLACASLAVSVSLTLSRPPYPQIQDEFSNLLLADTLCEGRLANPTHPHWRHFESFHIIHQPSYASKYPPGQGAVLALGQFLVGAPIAGMWLLSALATVACYWMLLGWTSPRWALLGGAVLIVHPGYHMAWGQLYWGGMLALLGGALVFGAALRIVRRSKIRDAVAMAVGAVVLAVSRPFEGLLVCLFVGGWVLLRWAAAGVPSTWRALLLKTVLPQALILLVGAWGLACYNRAVTGDPTKLPYSVYEQQYGQAPLFIGQAPKRPSYRHEAIEKFHSGWAMDWYRNQDSLEGVLRTKAEQVKFAATFFFPLVLAAPLVALLALRPSLGARGRLRAPLAIAGLTLLASLASLWNYPHYMAPIAPLLLIAVIAGLRYVEAVGCRRYGLYPYAGVLIAFQACLFFTQAVNRAATPPGGWHVQRAQIESDLGRSGDRHLIFVRYDATHDSIKDWVYNRADIDGSNVVWAREMDPASDAELVRYFADRKVWLLEPDQGRLQPMEAVESGPLVKTDGGPVTLN
jgi:hypothetical protein